MDTTTFRECLAALHWSQNDLSDILSVHPTTVRRWAAGDMKIPDHVGAWLKNLASHRQRHYLPDGWQDTKVKSSQMWN